MKQKSMNVMDIITRSIDAPSFPFKCEFEFYGFKPDINLVRKYNSDYGQIFPINNPIEWQDSFKLDKSVSDISNDDIYVDTITTTIEEICSYYEYVSRETNFSYVLHEHDGDIFVVYPRYKAIFKIYPEDSYKCYYGVVENKKKGFPSWFKSSRKSLSTLKRNYNQFTSNPDKKYRGKMKKEDSRIAFSDESLSAPFFCDSDVLIESIQSEVGYVIEKYDLIDILEFKDSYENEVVDYCAVELYNNSNNLVFKCDHADGPVTFNIQLNEFGSLPDWVSERLDLDDLLVKMDTETNLVAKIRLASENSDKNWVCELGDKELISIE